MLPWQSCAEVNTNFALKCIARPPIWRSHDHKRKSLPWRPWHVPFANGLLEGPFLKGLSYSLLFGTSLQMASSSRSALQGHKKAVWNLPIVMEQRCLSGMERWTLHSVASKRPWREHSIQFNLNCHITLTKVLNHLISLPLYLLNGFNGIVSLLKYGTAESRDERVSCIWPYVTFLWPIICSVSSNKARADALFFVLNQICPCILLLVIKWRY